MKCYKQLNEKSLKYDQKNGISNLKLLTTEKERKLMVSISRFSKYFSFLQKIKRLIVWRNI